MLVSWQKTHWLQEIEKKTTKTQTLGVEGLVFDYKQLCSK